MGSFRIVFSSFGSPSIQHQLAICFLMTKRFSCRLAGILSQILSWHSPNCLPPSHNTLTLPPKIGKAITRPKYQSKESVSFIISSDRSSLRYVVLLPTAYPAGTHFFRCSPRPLNFFMIISMASWGHLLFLLCLLFLLFFQVLLFFSISSSLSSQS